MPAGFRRERDQRDERERSPHDVFGRLVDAGPGLVGGIAEEALEDREREEPRRAEQPEAELAAPAEQRVGNERARSRVVFARGRDWSAGARQAGRRDALTPCREAARQRSAEQRRNRAPTERARQFVWCIDVLPGNQTDGAEASSHGFACRPRSSRLALYKEPPQMRRRSGNMA